MLNFQLFIKKEFKKIMKNPKMVNKKEQWQVVEYRQK